MTKAQVPEKQAAKEAMDSLESQPSNQASRPEVKDSGNFAYAIMFYQGVGQLFPWNAFITASAYFGQRLCVTNFKDDFENYLSISFTASQTIGLAVTILYGGRMSYHDKIVYPLYIYCSLFALTTILVLTDIDPNLLFWITLLCCIGCGASGAFLNAGFFSLSGVFPPSYTGAMMSGQGLAGFSVALTGLLTQMAGPVQDGFCTSTDTTTDDTAAPAECVDDTTNWSAFSYFTISTVVLASCIVLFFILMKLPFTIFNLRGQEQLLGRHSHDNYAMSEPLLSETYDKDNTSDDDRSLSDAVTSSRTSEVTGGSVADSTRSSLGLSGIVKRNKEHSSEVTYSDGESDPYTENPVGLKESTLMNKDDGERDSHGVLGVTTFGNIIAIFKVIKFPAITVFSCFAVTLSLFPSLTVFLRSSYRCEEGTSRFYNDLFVPMFFVMFNAGDFTGRLLAAKFPIFTKDNVHWAGIARLIFYPLFMLCNLGPGSRMPIVFSNDFFPFLFMSVFAVSNGYTASQCMMIGPVMVDPSDAPMAGNIMIFCLTAGLMGGSILSFFVTYISQGVF